MFHYLRDVLMSKNCRKDHLGLFKCVKHAYLDLKSWWESLKYAIELVFDPYAKEQAQRRIKTFEK